MQGVWNKVDDYFGEALGDSDPVLDAAQAASARAGLPPIAVSPLQGKMLHLLALSVGARRILEVGTLGGYSAIWLARALPADGELVTLEIDPLHARTATANLAAAGLADRAQVRLGKAADTLAAMRTDGAGPFDFTFIDADKPSNPDYFAHALAMSRPGALIVVDNVVRAGGVVDPSGDAAVQGVRRLAQMIAAEPRVTATAIQTVGAKGYDGFILARVNG